MKPKILVFSLYLTGLLATAPSCTEENEPDLFPFSENYTLTMENLSFYADHGRYNQVNSKREDGSLCLLDSDILRVQRNQNILALHIAKPVGCAVKYELVWDGTLMESFPMRANIFVRAIGENCGSSDLETEVLQVDLEKTFKTLSPAEIDSTIFNVRDACSQQDFYCMENCGLTVSTDSN